MRATTQPVITRCRPTPGYSDGKRLFVMDDFGSLVYLDPQHDTMDQWAEFLVDGIVHKH